ncbi:TerB family tellurite resistance protein [Paracoccus sp. YIM 132242]|uniref:TerB family tellurite resistance protein n=1 Tax=Paracoccus lichenicola TaxID=2665644 RepID=A0A6L6HKL1_9RHOB|nr:TerB family tellurite resistance protein [Paracoccus lichenicola]MTD98961.1 TerB family tellurite resistance protein [Paracoccus lichenicola]
MFRNLLNRLFTEDTEPRPLAADDAEVAVAALLVRVARADDHYNAVEKRRIDQVLARLHGLGLADAAERRSVAEMIEAEAPDTVRFTRLIKDRVSLDDRMAIIGAMWEISLADNHRAANEETAIRLVSGLLGVTDRDSALQRRRVAGGR